MIGMWRREGDFNLLINPNPVDFQVLHQVYFNNLAISSTINDIQVYHFFLKPENEHRLTISIGLNSIHKEEIIELFKKFFAYEDYYNKPEINNDSTLTYQPKCFRYFLLTHNFLAKLKKLFDYLDNKYQRKEFPSELIAELEQIISKTYDLKASKLPIKHILPTEVINLKSHVNPKFQNTVDLVTIIENYKQENYNFFPESEFENHLIAGASPNQCDWKEDSLLSLVICNIQDSKLRYKIVGLLILYGVNIAYRNKISYQNALEIAFINKTPDVLEIFVSTFTYIEKPYVGTTPDGDEKKLIKFSDLGFSSENESLTEIVFAKDIEKEEKKQIVYDTYKLLLAITLGSVYNNRKFFLKHLKYCNLILMRDHVSLEDIKQRLIAGSVLAKRLIAKDEEPELTARFGILTRTFAFEFGCKLHLVFKKNISIKQPEILINHIILHGYDNGEMLIFLKPANNITGQIVINKLAKLTHGLTLRISHFLKGIIIQISSKDDLIKFFSLLSSLQKLDSKDLVLIEETYKRFIQNPQNTDFVLSSPKDTKSSIEGEFQVLAIEDQKKLTAAVEKADVAEVESLLVSAVSPHFNVNGIPLLHFAIWRYVQNKLNIINQTKVISLLLDYGISPAVEHPTFDETALSSATNLNLTHLAEIITQHLRSVEFDLKGEDTNEKYSKVFNLLKEEFNRINDQAAKVTSQKLEIKFIKPTGPLSFPVTESKVNDQTIKAETVLTTKLTNEDIETLFTIYKSNFSSKLEPTIELQRKKFNQKFGLDNSNKKVYIDLIRLNGKIIGFNLFQVFQGTYKNIPNLILYASLAWIEPAFRGTRFMTLLGYRPVFALKDANPDIETYIVFDSIHPNSFLPLWDIKRCYPKMSVPESSEFAKYCITQIYGAERVNQFDPATGCLFTETKVIGSIDAKKCAIPPAVNMWRNITRERGGAFMIVPATEYNRDEFNEAINKHIDVSFQHHVEEFSECAFDRKGTKPWNNATYCLYAGRVMQQRLLIWKSQSIPSVQKDDYKQIMRYSHG